MLSERLSSEMASLIRRVHRSASGQFNVLVQLADLDKYSDFQYVDLSGADLRGADLRGFDFRGSDLRGCRRDELTIIDDTTILDDTDIDWIEERSSNDIVRQMLKVDATTSSIDRVRNLRILSNDYDSEAHIRKFIMGRISASISVDIIFDYFEFLEIESYEFRKIFNSKLKSIILSNYDKHNSRKIMKKSEIDRIIFRMKNSTHPEIIDVYEKYENGDQGSRLFSFRRDRFELDARAEALLRAIDIEY